ncbi:Major facilitator superfamily domain-containing protein 6 [Symbiodinium microadriaticum]|uniref:Major facilitator superfamily domain-containing protein 6 n=1 Tax=Symbiodinium microadriaticum TaxID=2951 RepID=A0A1Q9DPA2_SYMMI|nr:Major facilitator superfamily domain-containing protein 6 [Symbiodinium microadriaticum]
MGLPRQPGFGPLVPPSDPVPPLLQSTKVDSSAGLWRLTLCRQRRQGCQMAHQDAENTSILVLDDTDITGVAAAWADFVAGGRLVERAPPHALGRYRHGVGEVIPYGASRCGACGSAGADWACGGCGQACCQCAVWPALRLAPARWSFGWVLALMCMQAACSPGGLLTEITLRYVGTETYGKVRLWGGVGFATGSLLTGLLVQWLNASIGYDVIFLESLAVGLAMSGIAVGLSRTCSREQLLSTSSEMVSAQGGQDVNESVAQALHSRPRLRELMRFVTLPRVAVTLAIVVALGFGEGIMQTYTYVRLQHLKHGSSTIMGLSAVCMIISEIPFFYFAKNIIDRFGIMPIMSLALCCTALRQAWIAWLWDAAWVLPGELLHGITFSIANAAVTLDVHDIAPEHLQVRYCDDKCGRIHWSLHRTVCSSRARPPPALAQPSEVLPSSLLSNRSDGVLLAAKSLSVGDVLCSEPPLTWQPVPAMRASLCARCGATQALLRCAVCQQVSYCARCRSTSSSPCAMCPELSITQGHVGAFTLVGLEILRDWEEGRLQPGDLLKPSEVAMQQARGCSVSVQKVAHFCSAVRWSDERAEEILAAVIAGRIEHTAAGKPVGVGYYPSFARLRAGATSCEKGRLLRPPRVTCPAALASLGGPLLRVLFLWGPRLEHFAKMAEEDKTASAWYKVPTWDGSPLTWRAFEKEMQWWVSSLDLEATRKYNLAARWLLRQQGVVRQRGEEFTPKELEFQREVKTTDPDGVEIVVVQEDLLAGLNKLLKALETINGKTPLDRKGELRNQFYLGLQRRAGERPADFMSRFRSLTSELRAEGIALPAAELGWFLREKLGLDPLRKQLLETALQGRENYEDVETEVYEADAAEEEELVADESPHEAGLDELLENEAEALAAELDQAERDGCDEAVLGQLEDSYGNAAEALVSMREARAQLQAVRKDRGFGKAPSSGTRSGPSSPSSGGPAMKKRGLCWDCGLQGHWAGDAACAKPGAGLFKKTGGKGAGSSGPQAGSSPTRRVQLTETLAVETGAGDEENERVHEVSVASTLEEALEISEANAVGHLLGSEAERETFKFGNDGTKPSYERKRLPMLVGDSLILVWTSVVEVGALGLLLGRDFLEAIGGVISFTRRALRADHLDGRRVPLKQLAAGHLYLDMFPALSLEISEKRWKRQGVDGVIEVQEQAESMVKNGALPRRHYRRALLDNLFDNLELLKDGAYLRDRLGIRLAFLEDPMLDGMLAAKATRGTRDAIQNQLVDKLKREAAEKHEKGEALKAARRLLGPRGGLPTLKGDLLRLAVLLNVEVGSTETVDKIKQRLRPMVDALRGTPAEGTTTSAAASSSAPAARTDPLPAPPGDRRRDDQAQPPLLTAGTMPAADLDRNTVLREVEAMMEQRDNRMQAMLAQTMQHMMAMANQGQHLHGEEALSPDSNMGFTEAWGKYSRDRKLLKATAQDVREAFETVVTTASLQSFDRRPFFMCFRLAGPSPLLNFSGKQARLDAEKKNLESEAAVLQAAMAQRRSGRHFLIEFGRGARPDRTPEGKELLEELGEADFVMNGRRYVTSSPSFVTALRAGKDAALDDLAAMTLQGIERQLDEDHQAGNVHEGLAAETFDGDGSLLDLEEDESDVDEPGPVTEEERTVKAIPVAVRQAVRRLHENTGHRSPLRLARALVIAGAPPEAILAAKQLKCSLCDERRPPKVQRPASLPGPRDPGDQVGIDIFDVFDGVGTRFSVLHAVDAATRFQMAVLVERKASEEVVNFIRERWAPVFGVPRTLVCDQGREFISHELEDFASGVNMHLYHIAVGAPWQNGLCERTGGILKTLVSACVAARSLMGTEEMKVGLAEGLLAYNMDVGDSGFSPMQAAVGRQPMLPGDALGGGRLGELEALENPSYARLMAVREAAKMAMLRLHFSRSLKRAEKARSRNPTLVSTPAVGDLVYYWREQKYNKRASYNKRRLLLKKWHGPALLVAFEGSNCYVTARGTLTKVALEHVRRASAMEQLASGEWESVLQEIVDAAARDQEWEVIPQQGSGNSDGGPPPPGPPDGDDGPGLGEQPTLPEPTRGPMAPSTADGAPALGQLGLDVSDGAGLEQPTVPEPGGPLLGRVLPFRDQLRQAMSRGQEQRGRELPPVSTGEFVKATSGSAAGDSRRPSTLLGRRVSGASSSRAPGTPVPECILGAGGGEERSPVGPFEAETEPDGGSTKRPAELDAETLRDKAQGSDDTVPFDAMVMERSEVLAAAQAREGEVHPLVKLQAQAAMDRLSGDIGEAGDHGTWDGRWPLPSRTEYEAFVQAGLKWPTTRDAFVVQAARKEYHWSSMGPEQKAAFKDAAAEAWNVWLRNEAVEVLSDAESEKVWATLRQRGELHKVLTTRFVYTDKNDGQRTQQNNLPLKASARLVVPGYKDITAYGLRKDAPTASRTSQHLLFSVAASKFQDGWRMGTADVKSAFMKGERYMEGTRELYVKNVEVRGDSPSLPVGRKLSRVLKGVFGLADAPREWFLRLRKSVVRRGWRTSTMDAATFFLWSQDSTPRLLGMLCSHVDDLLFCGGPEAWSSIRELGDELGFGSLEENAFVYCGKRVAQDLASGEVTVSMKEYHQNLKEVRLPSSRRRDPDASLTPGEHKQLRALVGSLQWLVAQVRFDAGFLLSALQAETPTVNTLLKINQLIKLFKETGDFELRFRPLDLRNAGILVVTDASLGNVTRTGAVGSQPLERVYSQSCYCVLLAEASLMRGEKGRFTVLDHRSHRLQRVCRSTFAAELLGVEEGTDAGQYCRGHVAELQG